MNAAASAGKYVACHTASEMVEFVDSTDCAVSVAVEWQLADGSWTRPDAAAVAHCEWLINVRFEAVDDPINAEELDTKRAKESDSLQQLIAAPFGAWRNWLKQNLQFLAGFQLPELEPVAAPRQQFNRPRPGVIKAVSAKR